METHNLSISQQIVSLSPKIFDDNLRVTSASFFVVDFDLFSCEADNFTFIVLYQVILY